MSGPIPRREADLARPRSRKGGDQQDVSHATLLPSTPPKTPRRWHPIARGLLDGMKASGQRVYFQDSDWALAFSICDDISRFKRQEERADALTAARDEWFEEWRSLSPDEREARKAEGLDVPPQPGGKGGSAMKLTAALNALSGLMVTEGDRRRVRVELDAPRVEESSASVTAIAAYKDRLRGS